jgi:hypothetical protein
MRLQSRQLGLVRSVGARVYDPQQVRTHETLLFCRTELTRTCAAGRRPAVRGWDRPASCFRVGVNTL